MAHFKYKVEVKFRLKHSKHFQEMYMRFSNLNSLADFVVRTKQKYFDCEFKKYQDDQLVSAFY